MALKRNNKVEPVKKEVQESRPEETEPQEAPKEAPNETPTKEVAVKESSEVVIHTTDMPSIESLKDSLDARDFGNLFPRIVGSNSMLICKKGTEQKSLGTFIDVQVISTSARWMVTPKSEPGDKKAQKLCRASYDGKVIPGWDGEPDMPIEEWIQEIKNAGYPPNNVSKYTDIFCSIFNAEKEAKYAEEVGIVQVSVSPTAVKTLRAFTIQTPLMIARGQMLKTHQNCMRITSLGITGDTNYTVLEFTTVPIDIVTQYSPVLA